MNLKRLLPLLAFLLAIPMAYSTNVMTITGGECSSDGSATFSLQHVGSLLQTSDIKVQAKFEAESPLLDINGKWRQGDKYVNYIKVNFNEQPNGLFFIANPISLTKKGKYAVFFEFPRSAVVGDRSRIQFMLNCPGKTCASNIDCRDDENCNNSTCISLNCDLCQVGSANRCVSKCDDRDPCTVDLCNEGSCGHDKIPNCCKTDKDCFDAKACTTDTCTNNRCVREPITCKASTDPCTKGVCKEPIGCEYKANALCAANDAERTYVLNVGEPEITASSQSFLGKIFAYLASLFR